MRLRARPEGQRRAVDRERQLPQQEAQAAAVVLVAVGDDAALDPVGVLPQVGEVGQDQVDAGHVGVGEHQPAVEEHDPPVDLDAGAVAADLPEAAEEDDPDGSVTGLSHGDGRRRSAGRRPRAPPGPGPSGSRHWPGRAGRAPSAWPWSAPGWGPRRSTGSGATAIRRALTSRAWSTSPLAKAAIISATSLAGPVDSTEIDADRADGEQGQGVAVVAAVELEAGGRLGDQGRVPAGLPVASLTPMMTPSRGQPQDRPRGHLAPGPDRDVVEQHRQVAGGVGRWPGCGPRSRPGTAGCSTG